MESQDDSQSHDFFCFQVATSAEGYNSGRTYTLRTRSKELYDEILPLLTKLSKKARRRAEAHTLFQKCQWTVRKIYTHSASQTFIALVIMGVSNDSCFPSNSSLHPNRVVLARPPFVDHARARAELRVHHRRGAVQPDPLHRRAPRRPPRQVQPPLHRLLHPRAPRLRLLLLAPALPPRPLVLARRLCGAPRTARSRPSAPGPRGTSVPIHDPDPIGIASKVRPTYPAVAPARLVLVVAAVNIHGPEPIWNTIMVRPTHSAQSPQRHAREAARACIEGIRGSGARRRETGPP